MILACWRPRWRPHGGWGSNVQWRHLSWWTAHGAQHTPVAWPAFTFGRPLPAWCWASMYMLPFHTTWAPSNRTNQRAVKRAAIPVNRRGVQHVPVVRPPSTFGRMLRPSFELSPHARAGPKAAVVDDEGVSLHGELFSRHAVVLLPDPRHVAGGHYFSTHIQMNVPGPPPRHHVAHAGSRNEVIAGHEAACWPGTRPLQLLTVYCRFYVNFANAHRSHFFCLHFAAASVYHFSRQLLRLFPRQLRTTPLFWRPPLSCLFGDQSCGTRTLGWAGQTRPHRNPFRGPLHPG